MKMNIKNSYFMGSSLSSYFFFIPLHINSPIPQIICIKVAIKYAI